MIDIPVPEVEEEEPEVFIENGSSALYAAILAFATVAAMAF